MDLRKQCRKLQLYKQKSDEHAKKYLCEKCPVKSDLASSCHFFRPAELKFKDKNNCWWTESEINEGDLIVVEITVTNANCALVSDNQTV